MFSKVNFAARIARSQCRLQSSKILVGLSATPYGDLALKQAVRMSRDGDALVGIFVPPVLDPNVFPPNALAAMKARQSKQLQEIHDRAAKVVAEAKQAYGSKASFECKDMEPSTNRRRAIVDACWNLKADVLVLGSLGAGAVRRASEEEKVPFDEQRYQQNYHTVATVPDYAMHNAPCPVFVVKPKSA